MPRKTQLQVASPVHGRKFWHRWLLDPLMKQLSQGVTPEKIALTLALGSALALFPVLGTTTALCLVVGIALGLNQPIIQGVNGLCVFIYFPFLFGFVRIGDTLTGVHSPSLNVHAMVSLFGRNPGEFFRHFGITGLHAIAGWAVVAPALILIIYFASLFPLRAAARRMGG